jgi:hypothetical protein
MNDRPSSVVSELLALPDPQQVPRAMKVLRSTPEALPEAWNSRFADGSLFDAWTRTTIAQQAHEALAEAARPALVDGFSAVEVGAGNGRMWRQALSPLARGTLTVIDPVPEAIELVAASVPEGVDVRGVVGLVEEVDLPEADLIVCSMTLHHLAGVDAEQRAAHGLQGPGKVEVLERFRSALAPRDGLGLLLEADIDCELDLAPGDPALRDNVFDSYVRRCARSIVEADLPRPVAPDLHARWEALLRHWFLGQLAVADAPVAERDVYELTVDRWLAVLQRAGLTVRRHGFTDPWKLFCLYELGA